MPEGYGLAQGEGYRASLSPADVTNYRHSIYQYLAYQQNVQEAIGAYQAQVAQQNAAYQAAVANWQAQMRANVEKNIAEAEGLNADALAAYLEQVAAQYGYTTEDLGSQLAAINPALESALQQLGVYKKQGLEATENAALERGIMQSGIYAKGVGNVLSDVATQEMGMKKQAADAREGLNVQLARLPEQQASDIAIAQSDMAIALAQWRQQQEQVLLGAMMPSGPLPVASPIIPPYVTAPQLPLPGQPQTSDLYAPIEPTKVATGVAAGPTQGGAYTGGPGGAGAGTGAPYQPLSYTDIINSMLQRPTVITSPYTPVLAGGR